MKLHTYTEGTLETSARLFDRHVIVITRYKCDLDTGVLRCNFTVVFPACQDMFVQEKQLKAGNSITRAVLEMHNNTVQGQLLSISWENEQETS